jgi:hypothetical protein
VINKRKTITLTFLAISAILCFFWISSERAERFLSKNRTVKANILVVEGWLPQQAVDFAYNEFVKNKYDLVVTTGISTPDLDFFNVSMNGFLIFYPEIDSSGDNDTPPHSIEVLAHSKSGGRYKSHFNFYINDSLVADFTADEKVKRYGIKWNGSLNNIDSVMLHFDNDLVDDNGDRNLYIKEIIFDNKFIIPFQFNSDYDIGLLDGKNRLKNNYFSNSDIVRNTLIAKGIDSLKIVSVTGKRTWFNRTLTSVLSFRNWIKASGQTVTGINIVSMGMHSRRTWITYKKVMDKSYNIGVISLPDLHRQNSEISRYIKTIKEILDLLYYRLILIPY